VLPIVVFVIPGVDLQLAGMLGMGLGSVGAEILGLPCWALSWILPLVGFVKMENQAPIALLGVERVILIVGVAVLGLEWMLALDVAVVVVFLFLETTLFEYSLEDSVEMGVKLAVGVGIVGMAVLGLKWGMLWIRAIVVVALPPLLVIGLPLFILWVITD
jgi:hypothetical protein